MLLAELFTERPLGLVLRACPEALARPIRWVHTTELRDPGVYLSGGELILTTGVWRRRSADSEAFVGSLVASDACGLVYGLPRPHATTPPDLIEACRRSGLPLLEASHEQPFISISEAVIGRFAEEREAPLHRALRRNEQLVDALASGRGAGGILAVIAREGLTAWLLGAGARMLAQAGRSVATLDIGAAWRSVAAAPSLPADLQLPGAAPATAFALGALGGRGTYLVVDRRVGELDPEARAAIDQALAFLALELARVRAQRTNERRRARELLELLAAGPPRAADAATRLRALGLDPDESLAVVLALPLAGTAEELADALDAFAAEHAPSALAVAGPEVALVLAHEGETAREVAELLAAEAPVPVAVGAGTPARSADGWRRSVVEARGLAVFLAGRGRPGVASAGEIGSHELLLSLLDDNVRAAYREAVLGPLRTHDRRRGSALVETLDVFLESGGHWKHASARLHVHVNTLRHRLARIEQLTGRDLDATADRVDLFLALRMR